MLEQEPPQLMVLMAVIHGLTKPAMLHPLQSLTAFWPKVAQDVLRPQAQRLAVLLRRALVIPEIAAAQVALDRLARLVLVALVLLLDPVWA